MQNNEYAIFNDVLLTNSGTAYLIGGNHSVLNYITEQIKPEQASYDNFISNISKRAYIAHLCKSKYLHVIFPDKQSVLESDFPIKNTVRLGDKYIERIEKSPLNNFVLYPADILKQENCNAPYLKLDTHMSDHGSLLVIRHILSRIDETANEATSEISKLIYKKKNSHGDLGGKFEPKLTQESTHLVPNWDYHYFSSNGSFNNGQIDIYFNKDAKVQKKVLIFGDSFFRMMLLQLSNVFSEIVFLRTPFFHCEMIELIKPDIILTGNAERYLSHVNSDDDAPAFQIYSYTHNTATKPSQDFIDAFRAITSPKAKTSKEFIEKLSQPLSKDTLIVGPSHAVRWKQHVKNRVLDAPKSIDNLVGFGGAPIWSKQLFELVRQKSIDGSKFLLMVGDFRFGNGICLTPNKNNSELFTNGYAGINPEALSEENDCYMLEKSLKALELWNKTFSNNIRFLFWDLLCRQIQDRLCGRHVANKIYKHPHWNLESLQRSLPSENLIDLSPITHLPMHEAVRLFIDSSSHPSQIGYHFITNCFVYGMKAIPAFEKAVNNVEEVIFATAKDAIKRKGRPIILVGRSVWIDTFVRYLGSAGVERLARFGMSLVPFNSQLGHPIRSVMDIPINGTAQLIFVSENGVVADLPELVQNGLSSRCYKITATNSIAWELSCIELIKKRNETPRCLSGQTFVNNTSKRTLELNDADVELGPFGYPSMTGIIRLLTHL